MNNSATNRKSIGRKSTKFPPAKNAERERSRVRSLRNAFQALQCCLPSVPPDTKLSKLDILILATNYIGVLTSTLHSGDGDNWTYGKQKFPSDPQTLTTTTTTTNITLIHKHSSGYDDTNLNVSDLINSQRYLKFYHPIKKWPMRSRLYSMIDPESELTTGIDANNNETINNNNR